MSVDQQYYVYEFVLDKHNNKKARRKGVIRATGKVADNREINTGQSLTSRFYQVGGRKLREGMLLKQNSDLGVGLLLGVGSFAGTQAESFIRLGLDYNFSSLVSRNFPPGIHIFVSANFSAPKYDYFKTVNDARNSNMADSTFETVGIKKDFNTQNIELNIGLSKDFYFARNFCFTPSLSYQLGWVTLRGKQSLVKAASPNNVEEVDPSKDPYKNKSLSENKGVNAGATLYINIAHNF